MIDQRIGKIKVRRGTDLQRKLVTFEEGELVYSIDKKRLYIGNGTEKGGIVVSNRNYVKNSLGVPPVVPIEAIHGDIIHDKSSSKTYITKCDGLSCQLILIAAVNCCSDLQNEIDDLYNRLSILSACASESSPPPPIPTNLSWYIQPLDNTVNIGQTVTLTASAIGGFGTISYEWKRRDEVEISVVNNQPILTFTTQLSDIATYYCIASTPTQTIISQNAVITTPITGDPLSKPPKIIVQPKSVITTTLNPVMFTVIATGSEPLSYQWRINDTILDGETSVAYIESNTTRDKTGINCVVSNLVGSVTSNYVNLTVGIKPTITTQPISQTVNIGSSVTFSVVAAGSDPLSYQWNKNGVAIAGANSSSYFINNTINSDFGEYNCTVSNPYGSIVSDNAVLKNGCIIDMIEVLNNMGWDGEESSLNGMNVNFVRNVGCCASSSPTFNWGYLNINNFTLNISITGVASFPVVEDIPANLNITGELYGSPRVKGSLSVSGTIKPGC
jgi:hypothetical protein